MIKQVFFVFALGFLMLVGCRSENRFNGVFEKELSKGVDGLEIPDHWRLVPNSEFPMSDKMLYYTQNPIWLNKDDLKKWTFALGKDEFIQKVESLALTTFTYDPQGESHLNPYIVVMKFDFSDAQISSDVYESEKDDYEPFHNESGMISGSLTRLKDRVLLLIMVENVDERNYNELMRKNQLHPTLKN